MIISTSLKKKESNRLVKNLIKKELPKKPIKDDLRKFNERINKEETVINRKLFEKHFNFQRTGAMLKTLYDIIDRKAMI